MKLVVRTLWRGLDALRRFLHLLLLLTIFVFVLAGLAPDQAIVPDGAALVLAPEGALVEQLSGDPLERAIARARGLPQTETLVKDLVEAIRAAAEDDRINALVLNLDQMSRAGLSKLQEIANEIVMFKASGKTVVAAGDAFSRDQYYLAAHADELYLNPMGLIFIDGYGRYTPYFRTAIENLSIDFNVWTVGEYKSFVEPITRDDMSEEDREASSLYLEAIWDAYQEDVTAARELDSLALQRYADDAPELLRAAGGDTARMALESGLVDELLPRDVIEERIRTIVNGASDDEDSDDFARIGHAAYLSAIRAPKLGEAGGDRVGVLVASGMILDGAQPPGTIGGDSTAELVRRANDDDDIKALVLRVDSPGGSAFASEVVLRELEVFQQSGRPLVVSMGSVAASGGYWISMSADEIWASPTTLTGSIGIGATLPTFQRSLDRLGVHVDGLGTTELSGQLDPLRELGPDISDLIGQAIRYGYDQFIEKVADHRDRSVQQIDAVARGRVWVASDAQERGLVDRLGNLDDAIASAADLAGLAEDEYEVFYLEKELGLAERIALELARVIGPVANAVDSGVGIPQELQSLVGAVAEPLRVLERFNDPRDIYAYCFCDFR
ncbi:MAG TPA: signal peptide peptidase SppA [Gammaproteobacteria bacterium]